MDGKGYHIRVWITNIIFDDKLVFTYNYKKGIQTMSLAIVFAAFGSDSGAGRSPYRKPRSYAVNGLAARFFFVLCGVVCVGGNVRFSALLEEPMEE